MLRYMHLYEATNERLSAMKPRYATYVECAHLLRLSPSMVKKLVRAGKLPEVKFGTSARIPLEALEQFGKGVK